MTKPSITILAAALFAAGSFLVAQEAAPAPDGANAEAPRLTPEERRERWERLRNLGPEERRAQIEQWREGRGGPSEAALDSGRSESPPENYLEQLEFRSILTLDGITEFSLRNPWEGRTFLISDGNPRNGIEVVEFDAEQGALTLRHEGDTRTLHLQASRVATLEDAEQDWTPERRREMWEARRERFQQFQETWQEAVENSEELREIERQFGELVGEFRENRGRMRDMAPGSDEWDQARAQEHQMREEFRLLTEYSLLEIKENPAFEGQDVEALERMMRGMMMRQGAWGPPGHAR